MSKKTLVISMALVNPNNPNEKGEAELEMDATINYRNMDPIRVLEVQRYLIGGIIQLNQDKAAELGSR